MASFCTALLPLLLISLSAPAAESRITLHDIRATITSSPSPALRVRARVHNTLPVAITHVYLGLIYGRQTQDIPPWDIGHLYSTPPSYAKSHYGTLLQTHAITLGPRAHQNIAFTAPIPAAAVDAQAFGVHLLGYDLGDAVYGGLLLSLLHTGSPADEWAAAHAMGLVEAPEEANASPDAVGTHPALTHKQLTRARFAHNTQLAITLADTATAALAAPLPDHKTTLTAVYCILALGVLGGPIAHETLTQLAKHGSLRLYDEPLQVIAIAKRQRSVWESPLAHALPPSVHSLHDVITAAEVDLNATYVPPPTVHDTAQRATHDAVAATALGPSATTDPTDTSVVFWATSMIAVSIVVLAAFLGLRMLRR